MQEQEKQEQEKNVQFEKEMQIVKKYKKSDLVKYDHHFFDMRQETGLDYRIKGAWHGLYAKMFQDLGINLSNMIDVGGCMGAIASAFADMLNETVDMVEFSQYACDLKTFANVNYIHGDATKLSLPKKYDFLHSAEVLGHIQPKDSHRIAKSFYKIMNSGGIVFICYEKSEKGCQPDKYGAIDASDPCDPDPTCPEHINRRPEKYWIEQFEGAGFIRRTDLEEKIINSDFVKTNGYTWPILIWEK